MPSPERPTSYASANQYHQQQSLRSAPPTPQQQHLININMNSAIGLNARSASPNILLRGGGGAGMGTSSSTPLQGGGTTSSSAIGLTPDHGTGYAAGLNTMMVKENVDAALEAQGLSTNAVQVGILKAKVQGLQSELSKAKQDCKEATEKLTATSSKLNAEKIQNSSLLHKQNALMSKLSEVEATERELEEALLGEKKAHNVTREALEKVRNNRDDLEVALQNAKDALHRFQNAQGANAAAGSERLKDRSQYIPAAEHNEMKDQFRRAHEALIEQVRGSFERIAATQEEDETSLFISRSAVLSSATDLETKLCHAENMLELLKGTMERFTREFEEDAGRMMLSLMTENKELWSTVSKQQFELDRASAELSSRGRREDYVHKDQLEYLNKTITSLEERLRKSHEAIEAQTEAARTHAERMRDVLDENEALRRHLSECEQDLFNTREALAAKEREADELTSQNKSFLIQIQDLSKANQHLQTQITTLTNELRSARETLENETRSTIRQLQNERNDAIDAANRLRSDLEDANQRLISLERELETRTAQFTSAKNEWEVQHNSVVQALRDEIANTRAIFENELEELRRDISMKDDDLRRMQRELDALRLDQQNRSGAARAIEEARSQLEREVISAKNTISRLEERVRKLTAESDQFRNSSITLDGRVQTLMSENSRLQSQVTQLENSLADERGRFQEQNSHLEREWTESERTRTTLIEEITKLRAKANEDNGMKILKERMEKEKEMLMAENVRLHQQYQDVQQQNVSLQQQLTQLRGKLSGIGQLSQQLDDVQRRLGELPALRQQAEEARREAIRAKEETEALRQERDEMSQRLEFFLEEARVNAKKDTDLDRLFREASNQVRRLDQQIDEVTHRQPASEATLPASSSSVHAQYRSARSASASASAGGGGGGSGLVRGASGSPGSTSHSNAASAAGGGNSLNLPPHPTSASVYASLPLSTSAVSYNNASGNGRPSLASTKQTTTMTTVTSSSRVEDFVAGGKQPWH